MNGAAMRFDRGHARADTWFVQATGLWRASASRKSIVRLSLAIVCALLYAGATAALVRLIQWLAVHQGSAAARPGAHEAVMIAAVFGRPFFYTAHIHLIVASIEAMAPRAAAPRPIVLSKRQTNRMLNALAILTRDAPTILILVGAMIWQAGTLGLIVGLLVLAGLPVAVPAQRWASRRYAARHAADASTPDARLAFMRGRKARALGEASSEMMLGVLVVGAIGLQLGGWARSLPDIAALAVTAMLLGGPIRRIARLLGPGAAVGDGGGG